MAQALTTADRIRDLNSINEQVAGMLKAAGLAINTLTGRSAPTEDGEDVAMTSETASVESTTKAFEAHVTEYYTGLQAVVARLRRQTYALEEAGIISSQANTLLQSGAPVKDAAAARATSANVVNSELGRVTNGGMGNLDISWLNSRSNKVAAEKENELMLEVDELLRNALAKNESLEQSDIG